MANSHTRQTNSPGHSRGIAFLVPAVSSPSRRRPAIAQRARRRAGLCGGIAIALMICGGSVHAEAADAPPQDLVSAADRIAIFVEEAAHRFGVPESWIRAVMQVESNDELHAVSPKGAIGLVQIISRPGRACERATRWASIHTTFTTISWQAPPSSASFGTATARPVFWPLTTPAPGATKNISRPAGRCPPRHRLTSPGSSLR